MPIMLEITPAVGIVRKEHTKAQRLSSKFSESPTAMGKILRRGQKMRITLEQYRHRKTEIDRLVKAGSITVKDVEVDSASPAPPTLEEILKAGYGPEAAAKIFAEEREKFEAEVQPYGKNSEQEWRAKKYPPLTQEQFDAAKAEALDKSLATVMLADASVFNVILKQGEDGFVVATCPDVPGCVSQGKTHDEALANVREALELNLGSGKEAPAQEAVPKVLDDAMVQTEVQTGVVAEVAPADQPSDKAGKKNKKAK